MSSEETGELDLSTIAVILERSRQNRIRDGYEDEEGNYTGPIIDVSSSSSDGLVDAVYRNAMDLLNREPASVREPVDVKNDGDEVPVQAFPVFPDREETSRQGFITSEKVAPTPYCVAGKGRIPFRYDTENCPRTCGHFLTEERCPFNYCPETPKDFSYKPDLVLRDDWLVPK